MNLMKIIVFASMTAAKEMLEAEKQLISLGHEVILPEFTHHYAELDTTDEMHIESAHNKVEHDLIKGYFEKIKIADVCLVFNIDRNGVSGYIGGNTFLEMGFAHVLDKKIFVLNSLPKVGYSDEILAMKPVVINGDFSIIK